MSVSNAETTCKRFFFTSQNYRLWGTLHLPRKKRPSVVIGSHGLFATSQSPKQLALAEACVASGLAFFRFDHRGCGKSQGDFKQQISFKARCHDLLEACAMVLKREDTGDRIALFGSSLGGAAALWAASRIAPDALVTFAAPLDSTCVYNALEKTDFSFSVPRKDRDLLQFDISGEISNVENVLIVHGDRDTVVPPSHAQGIYRLVSEPKKVILQENGDHRMSHEPHQVEFIRVAQRWFSQGFERSPHAGLLDTE